MAETRKRRSPRRRILAAALFILPPWLYCMSFGPACWLCARGYLPPGPTGLFYWPFVWRGHQYGTGTDAVNAYADFWGKPNMIEVLRDAAAQM